MDVSKECERLKSLQRQFFRLLEMFVALNSRPDADAMIAEMDLITDEMAAVNAQMKAMYVELKRQYDAG